MKYALEKPGITHYMMFSGSGRKLKMSEEKPDN